MPNYDLREKFFEFYRGLIGSRNINEASDPKTELLVQAFINYVEWRLKVEGEIYANRNNEKESSCEETQLRFSPQF